MQRIRKEHLVLAFLLISACGSRGGGVQPITEEAGAGKAAEKNEVAPPKHLTMTRVQTASVTLAWEHTGNADTYQIYHAQKPIRSTRHILAHERGGWTADVRPPHEVKGLENNQRHYFVVTAMSDGHESPPSNMVSASLSEIPARLHPSPEEVRMIELVNRARFDPAAELDRHPNVTELNDGLASKSLTGQQKPPLAFSPLLMTAARNHSSWMLESGRFSHTGNGGSKLQERIEASGYGVTSALGENISVRGYRELDPERLIKAHHNTLFESPSHRVNILRSSFKELGVAQEFGNFTFDVGTFSSSMLTQNYASNGQSYFVTGVIYSDVNKNGIYDIGEGLPDVVVALDGDVHRAYNSGIYSIPVTNNNHYTITISGGRLPWTVRQKIEIADRNVKLDVRLVDGFVEVNHW